MTPPALPPALPLDTSQLKPGLRLGIGLSGGADSVALTCALAARSAELGIVLHLAHLHHGLRGDEAEADQRFCAGLAASLNLRFHTARVDTEAESRAQRGKPRESKSREFKPRESIEEAARRLRYSWFRQLMSSGAFDAIATAHSLDDQAETVLGKFLRGAWTEGLSGIHPIVIFPEGPLFRPLLQTTRPQVEAYLHSIGQPWREDASNLDPAFTRNRLRHSLLPELEQWNPRIREHLAAMAELARDEEAFWQSELVRLTPQLLLTGKPVRGGGRAAHDYAVVAIDVVRLGAQALALQRRLLRYAAETLGVSLNFEATESLRQLVAHGRSGQQLALPGPLTAERTPRELRLSPAASKSSSAEQILQCALPVPGEANAFGLHFKAHAAQPAPPALIRNWRPGDRVTLRYSTGPRKIKEILERLKVTGTARAEWPVVEWKGRIVWMRGAELQLDPTLAIEVEEATT